MISQAMIRPVAMVPKTAEINPGPAVAPNIVTGSSSISSNWIISSMLRRSSFKYVSRCERKANPSFESDFRTSVTCIIS